jgi:4-carboxymuconolactone decarboxylase
MSLANAWKILLYCLVGANHSWGSSTIREPAFFGSVSVSNERHAEGMKVRRAVLGDAHVDRAEARKTAFDSEFQQFITESAWGSVWTRPGLDRSTRSLLTLVILASLGHWEEYEMHIRASRNTGATPELIKEALFHVAVYAGVPAANRAFAIAKETLAEKTGSPQQRGPT